MQEQECWAPVHFVCEFTISVFTVSRFILNEETQHLVWKKSGLAHIALLNLTTNLQQNNLCTFHWQYAL